MPKRGDSFPESGDHQGLRRSEALYVRVELFEKRLFGRACFVIHVLDLPHILDSGHFHALDVALDADYQNRTVTQKTYRKLPSLLANKADFGATRARCDCTADLFHKASRTMRTSTNYNGRNPFFSAI